MDNLGLEFVQGQSIQLMTGSAYLLVIGFGLGNGGFDFIGRALQFGLGALDLCFEVFQLAAQPFAALTGLFNSQLGLLKGLVGGTDLSRGCFERFLALCAVSALALQLSFKAA